MNKTAIGWTDYSANPLKYRDASGRVVWGCAKVSPGCTHCYSEALAKRWNKGADYNAGEMAKLTPFLDDKELHAMLTSRKIAGKRVFVGDMTDVFGEWVPDELLLRLFDAIRSRPDVTFQILTKRAERMRDFCGRLRYSNVGERARIWLEDSSDSPKGYPLFPHRGATGMSWVWLGVSVEDQQRANERIPLLLQTPAAVRFISAEPLLGSVHLPSSVAEWAKVELTRRFAGERHRSGHLDWVVVGGESGANFRHCEVEWIENIVRDCEAAGVPVFVKQDAHRRPGQQGRIPDALYRQEFPA